MNMLTLAVLTPCPQSADCRAHICQSGDSAGLISYGQSDHGMSVYLGQDRSCAVPLLTVIPVGGSGRWRSSRRSPRGRIMTPTATLPPHTVDEIITRTGRPDFDRWAEQVARCEHCSRPVQLRGCIEHRSADGRRVAYSTDAEPDRVLLVRCGNRRAAACPSCSYEYAGDMWQLLYVGAAGGRKGVPESIQCHPLVFATLTAPGFGPVHTTRADRSGG